MPIKLRRAINLTLLCAAVGTAVFVFNAKKSAENEAGEIAELKEMMAAERQRISELRAEWSMLDDPARLQSLVERHADVLELTPIEARQIGALEDIPSRVPARTPENDAGEATPGGER